MAYRQIIIKEANKLSFKDNQLIVSKEEQETKVPLEDVNFILLEDTKTIITSKLLFELGNNAISLIICNDNHEPSSLMYPFNYHYKQLETLEKQINQTKEHKKELWNLIVKKKISNQIKVLDMHINDEDVINKLKQFQEEVTDGDIANREGLSAKMYFRSLFGNDFIRFEDDSINAALNYGYTIIKSAIVRELSVMGLNTYLGINHHSKTNAFNLAYDLIEPYRAVIDNFVYKKIDKLTYPLSFEIRKEIVNLLNEIVEVNSKKYSLEFSISLFVKSYIRSLDTGIIELELPTIIYDK